MLRFGICLCRSGNFARWMCFLGFSRFPRVCETHLQVWGFSNCSRRMCDAPRHFGVIVHVCSMCVETLVFKVFAFPIVSRPFSVVRALLYCICPCCFEHLLNHTAPGILTTIVATSELVALDWAMELGTDNGGRRCSTWSGGGFVGDRGRGLVMGTNKVAGDDGVGNGKGEGTDIGEGDAGVRDRRWRR